MKIYLVTTNQKKLLTAQKVLSKYGVELEIISTEYEVPEIQAFDVESVAAFSAKYVADKENKPIILTDTGYFINALNGFPGPYIKQMNHYFSTDDLLKLMVGKSDRSFVMKECLAFCMPGMEPVTYTSINNGTIAETAHGEGTTLDKVIIREGQDKIQALYSLDEMIEYYSNHLDHYDQFGKYYVNSLK